MAVEQTPRDSPLKGTQRVGAQCKFKFPRSHPSPSFMIDLKDHWYGPRPSTRQPDWSQPRPRKESNSGWLEDTPHYGWPLNQTVDCRSLRVRRRGSSVRLRSAPRKETGLPLGLLPVETYFNV